MLSKVILKVTEGPMKGQFFEFNEHNVFIFGRAQDCHARLSEEDETISRHHFLIEVNPPDARIRDLGSLNGTYLNGKKIGGRAPEETPQEVLDRQFPNVDLKDGDQIRAGRTVFTVQIESPAFCCDCGRPIADEDREACQWVAKTFICPGCRQKALRAAEAPKKPVPIRCKLCGRDVSAELKGVPRQDYICNACQAKDQVDPLSALLKMFLQAAIQKGETPPKDIPGHEVISLLRKGGMGAVYLARRKKDGATVALKVMLSRIAVDEDARRMFLQEIEVTRNLRHPNIVELLDYGSAGSGFYFVMEYCSGGSVKDLQSQRRGKLKLEEVAPIMLQALEGLAFIHSKGFVHRDLKPENILLTEKENGTVKVSDFGLAKNFEMAGFSGMTATGAFAGTYPYMPREQVTNFRYVKPPTDVWSMGATFYHLLTGQFPRDSGRGQDPVLVILREPVVPIRQRDRSIPKKVAEVIDCALQDKIEKRYPTAAEFRKALEDAL